MKCFSIVMKGLVTQSLKEVMLSVVVLMSVAAFKSSYVLSISIPILQHTTWHHLVYGVAYTREAFSAWRDLLTLTEMNIRCIRMKMCELKKSHLAHCK